MSCNFQYFQHTHNLCRAREVNYHSHARIELLSCMFASPTDQADFAESLTLPSNEVAPSGDGEDRGARFGRRLLRGHRLPQVPLSGLAFLANACSLVGARSCRRLSRALLQALVRWVSFCFTFSCFHALHALHLSLWSSFRSFRHCCSRSGLAQVFGSLCFIFMLPWDLFENKRIRMVNPHKVELYWVFNSHFRLIIWRACLISLRFALISSILGGWGSDLPLFGILLNVLNYGFRFDFLFNYWLVDAWFCEFPGLASCDWFDEINLISGGMVGSKCHI